MPIYVTSDTVVVSGDQVATSETCCCPIGACCVGTDCTIESETDCTGIGGTYQGDDTTCDPNPCRTTGAGACCRGEVCDIETADACAVGGGIYYGDDSVCDPNPCALPPCNCELTAFQAFDGSGRLFRTITTTGSGTMTDNELPAFNITINWNSSNSDSCDGPCSCTGTASSTCEGTDCSGSGCNATATDCGGGCGGGQSCFSGLGGCSFTNPMGCGPPPSQPYPASCSPPVISGLTATTLTATYDCSPSGSQTYHAVVNQVLSDECFP